MELPYVKECLAISGSKLVENDETVKNVKGKKGKNVAKPVPKEKGVEAVIAYMKDNESNSTCQTNALKALNELVKKGKDVSNGAKKLIASIMRKHIAKEEVQTTGCRLLATLAAQGLVICLFYVLALFIILGAMVMSIFKICKIMDQVCYVSIFELYI